MCLNETWLKYKGEFDSFLEGYVHYDYNRPYHNSHIRNSGGVSIYL